MKKKMKKCAKKIQLKYDAISKITKDQIYDLKRSGEPVVEGENAQEV